jgi:hypothetical protein
VPVTSYAAFIPNHEATLNAVLVALGGGFYSWIAGEHKNRKVQGSSGGTSNSLGFVTDAHICLIAIPMQAKICCDSEGEMRRAG